MIILQLSSAQTLGGGERHVSQLCQELARRGHKIHLVIRPGSPLANLVNHLPNITCHTLPLRGAIDLFSAYQLACLIKEHQVEIVQAHYARDYPLAALAIRYARRSNRLPAFFLTRHHYLPLRGNAAYRYLLKVVDCAIAVSTSVRNTLTTSFAWSLDGDRPRVEIVPNWIDIREFSLPYSGLPSTPNEWGLKMGAPVIGLINQITPAKGQETLLRAAALLGDHYPDLQFVFAGKEHDPAQPYTKFLQQLAKELNLSSRVIFAGYVAALPQLLQVMDMVVIPSENEAFSLVCLEAMAARRPVIASDVGGLAELIKHGETGLLFPVGNSEAMAKHIATLLSSTTLCQQLTDNAYQFVWAHFDRAQVIDRIEELYGKMLEKRHS